ncbi:MAG: glycoside hydrolase family 127 protein [Abitibacteriaceae bacterium]|nr:glycoside hydrolase family 127 protein [Abditibacteriaceae bacterium]
MPVPSEPTSFVVDTTHSPHAQLRPVPLRDVTLSDTFWQPRRRINQEKTLPSQYQHCETTGRVDNFRRASGKKDIPFEGIFFNDSDIYKWLEAAAWTLATENDPDLVQMVETVEQEIADAQQPDGYLNTYFMFDKAQDRWTNLKDMHELYCAGHFIQAAVAHYRATGKDNMLQVACRLANYISDTFGPKEEGKQYQTDGHEEIELALVELYRATGEAKYLKQAQFFIDVRGHGTIGGSSYHQDHKPVRELDRMTGHAVRAVYLNAGVADLLAETGEGALRTALDRLWDNMTTKQMYVSGGIGSRYEGEAFGKDYELPNERAYTETCAAIGSVMWNWRMLMLEGDSRYADFMELALYNGVMAGLSLDGQSYFYQNPLADDGTHRRQPWFGCACCPPNVARLLASLPAYFYSTSDKSVWVHLYAEGNARLDLPNGGSVAIEQTTRYPWDGDITLRLSEVEASGDFSLLVRIPSWCEEDAQVQVNGAGVQALVQPGTYAEVRRAWQTGDTVHLYLPMPVRRIVSHPYALENVGRVALMRGPLLYCLEAIDNLDIDLRDVMLPEQNELSAQYNANLLNGVVVLNGEAEVAAPEQGWQGQLYRTTVQASSVTPKSVSLTAIPYYAWANREPGQMQVWLRG